MATEHIPTPRSMLWDMGVLIACWLGLAVAAHLMLPMPRPY